MGPSCHADVGDIGGSLGHPATRTGETAAAEKVKLLQALSITLQRENARAVVRRAGWDPAAATAALDQP